MTFKATGRTAEYLRNEKRKSLVRKMISGMRIMAAVLIVVVYAISFMDAARRLWDTEGVSELYPWLPSEMADGANEIVNYQTMTNLLDWKAGTLIEIDPVWVVEQGCRVEYE